MVGLSGVCQGARSQENTKGREGRRALSLIADEGRVRGAGRCRFRCHQPNCRHRSGPNVVPMNYCSAGQRPTGSPLRSGPRCQTPIHVPGHSSAPEGFGLSSATFFMPPATNRKGSGTPVLHAGCQAKTSQTNRAGTTDDETTHAGQLSTSGGSPSLGDDSHQPRGADTANVDESVCNFHGG